MAKGLTMARYEAKLNDTLSSVYNEEEAFEQYEYLCNARRRYRCTEMTLRKYIRDNQLGTLIRRLDPIQFNVMYNEQRRE